MGLLCVNHETGESRPSHSVRLLRVALDGVEIRSTFNPGVPATLETPGVSILGASTALGYCLELRESRRSVVAGPEANEPSPFPSTRLL